MTVAALVIHLLSAWAFSKISFNQVACPLMRMASSSFPNIHNLWQLLFPLASSAIYIYLLITIRSFLQNLYQEKIFSHSNIDLCNRAWKILLVLSFMSGTLETSGNAYLLPFTFQFTFNTGLLPCRSNRLGLWQDFRERD